MIPFLPFEIRPLVNTTSICLFYLLVLFCLGIHLWMCMCGCLSFSRLCVPVGVYVCVCVCVCWLSVYVCMTGYALAYLRTWVWECVWFACKCACACVHGCVFARVSQVTGWNSGSDTSDQINNGCSSRLMMLATAADVPKALPWYSGGYLSNIKGKLIETRTTKFF